MIARWKVALAAATMAVGTPVALAAEAAPPHQPDPAVVLDELLEVQTLWPSQSPYSAPWRDAFSGERKGTQHGFVRGYWKGFEREVVPSKAPDSTYFVTESADQFKWHCYRASAKAKCHWRSPGAIWEVAHAQAVWLSSYNFHQISPLKGIGDYGVFDSFSSSSKRPVGSAIFFRRGATAVAIIVVSARDYPARPSVEWLARLVDSEIVRRTNVP